MPLVIINDGLVVKLGRADSKAVVGIGRGQKKSTILQERADQLVVLRRCFSEHRIFWIGVETARQLGQRSVGQQLLEVPIDGIRPARQFLAAIDLSRPQMRLECLKFCHGKNVRETRAVLQGFSLKNHAENRLRY